ncbi:MAG: hypothetical protein FWF08_02465 [Oscillospiraceae bacterium]|nr:hypothetical protein [Oscillospiraceae bacterium]
MKNILISFSAFTLAAAAFFAWYINFRAGVFLTLNGSVELTRLQLISIAAFALSASAAMFLTVLCKYLNSASFKLLPIIFLCSGLCLITAVSVILPVFIETSYIRGVQGVNYFYKLYDNLPAWETRKELIIDSTLYGFYFDLEKAKKAPGGAAEYAPQIYVEEENIFIERFYVETVPGYYLSANIYVSADPAVNQEPLPLIMLAHGHFSNGPDYYDRFFDDIQYFGAAFAKRGFLVVAWDMVGRGDDSGTLPHRNIYNTVLQTYNSMSLLSYLLSERFAAESTYKINEKYVAVTGASGGGTQTIYMSMFDDRLTASVPVAMVSAYFNGDCPCENGINTLKMGSFKTNGAERIAAFAPKPLLVISDGADWTKRNPKDEYPFLRYVYSFYGAEQKAESFHDADGKHDYGFEKRRKTLDFLLRQWELPENGVYDIPYTKDGFKLMNAEELKTFSDTSGLARPDNYVQTCEELYKIITERH